MYKAEKLGQEILKELYALKYKIDELNNLFLNFTKIDVTPNKRFASCYYTTQPEDKNNMIAYFEKNTNYIKHLLLKKISVRRFPSVKFVYQDPILKTSSILS